MPPGAEARVVGVVGGDQQLAAGAAEDGARAGVAAHIGREEIRGSGAGRGEEAAVGQRVGEGVGAFEGLDDVLDLGQHGGVLGHAGRVDRVVDVGRPAAARVPGGVAREDARVDLAVSGG